MAASKAADDDGGCVRCEGCGKVLFIFDENEVSAGCSGDAGDSRNFEFRVSDDAGANEVGYLLQGAGHGDFSIRRQKPSGLELGNGAQGLLDQLYGVGTGSGFAAAVMVGAGGDHPGGICQLVDRVSE